jgi:hypothetical protein
VTDHQPVRSSDEAALCAQSLREIEWRLRGILKGLLHCQHIHRRCCAEWDGVVGTHEVLTEALEAQADALRDVRQRLAR